MSFAKRTPLRGGKILRDRGRPALRNASYALVQRIRCCMLSASIQRVRVARRVVCRSASRPRTSGLCLGKFRRDQKRPGQAWLGRVHRCIAIYHAQSL